MNNTYELEQIDSGIGILWAVRMHDGETWRRLCECWEKEDAEQIIRLFQLANDHAGKLESTIGRLYDRIEFAKAGLTDAVKQLTRIKSELAG